MTISNKMKQTVASAEGVLANLESFVLETQDNNAKQLFQGLAQSQKSVVDSLKGRLQYIQGEEPEYKQV